MSGRKAKCMMIAATTLPAWQGEQGVKELEALFAEYALTLDDENPDESYGTYRSFFTSDAAKFVAWLKARPQASPLISKTT